MQISQIEGAPLESGAFDPPEVRHAPSCWRALCWKLGRFLMALFLVMLPQFAAAQKSSSSSSVSTEPSGFVEIVDMKMIILPGTGNYLNAAIHNAETQGAKLVVIKLDTPGGLVETTQQMIQAIFKSTVPVVVYVTPTGATATSAGVFLTMAAHVAALAPGTSIGAAHPVQGNGQDIEGDMRKKAENMVVALVKAVAERRGRNVEWVEKAITESNSLTEKEALKQGVIDVVADDVDDLLRQIAGREVRVGNETRKLGDYSRLERRNFEISLKDKALNVLANPNVAALLWLGATTGISLELYNPGVVLPGVVGVICLILALAVSQIIPVNTGAILLLVVGGLLIGAELYTGSLVLGVGGVIGMALGAFYLFDTAAAPGIGVAVEYIVPLAVFLGSLLCFVAWRAAVVLRQRSSTGIDGLIGQRGRAVERLAPKGRVFVNGEYWDARAQSGEIEAEAEIEVVGQQAGYQLTVKAPEH